MIEQDCVDVLGRLEACSFHVRENGAGSGDVGQVRAGIEKAEEERGIGS